MEERDLKLMAAQFRKPKGELGIQVGEFMNQGNGRINYDALQILKAGNEDRILEIGMGNGYFVSEILEKNSKVKYTGCEISDEMVEEALKINEKYIKTKQADFVKGNIRALPFAKEAFDKIITINTIYFWDDEMTALNELKRVLKPNGQLIISLRPKHYLVNYPFTKYNFNLFSKDDVLTLLEKSQFKISQVFENIEPPYDLQGEIVELENIIIVASKN
ncbi:class I SAM-dependent methyltransferase [Aurantibacillus circumpalustris]|uniref:class I SAM-dependent methyltransferase n=1 Tax=Aurantibacillus circumpalustris TaxID=3036359 RepID=UPI00295B5DE1|nr:class I SAM-dependent methyltransferase [Aurantibacillus circumpalustris]